MSDKQAHVIVIGSGISGSTAAAEIMKNATTPTKVTIVEQIAGRFGGGVAYGQSSAYPVHQTNTESDRMAQAITGNATEVLSKLGVAGNKVIQRHQLGELMRQQLKSTSSANSMLCALNTVYGEAMDITDVAKLGKVYVDLKDGLTLVGDRVVIATGNNDNRQLPASKTPDKDDPAFQARFVEDQWLEKGHEQINAIPKDQPVLIVGTALSAYDAVRTLLANGHTGNIKMVSRHALEHYQFPEVMDRSGLANFKMTEPRFLSILDNPAAALKEMLVEFKELTGLTVDLKNDTVEPKNWRDMYLKGWDAEFYQPGLVMMMWERYLPAVMQVMGMEAYGQELKKHTSLINVLRMGVGYYASEEIEAAKKTGQLEVVAADIDALKTNAKGGVTAYLTDTETGQKVTCDYHTVISSLGPNHDYARTKSELWNNVMKKGYTKPHAIGVGICVDAEKCPGALPGSENIFVVGTPASGEMMAKKGVIGPPAFSVAMMHEGTVATAQYVCASFERVSGKKAETNPASVSTQTKKKKTKGLDNG